MRNIALKTLATAAIAATTLTTPLPAQTQLRSQSGEIIVMEPHNLPEAAQAGGNSFFLHSDESGNTYLYVEQQQGARLAVFDVTDPAHVKSVIMVPLTVSGPFDFVRPLDGKAELIRFRDGKTVGVLDLAKAKKPSIRIVSPSSILGRPNRLESLGSWASTSLITMSAPSRGITRLLISQRHLIRSC